MAYACKKPAVQVSKVCLNMISLTWSNSGKQLIKKTERKEQKVNEAVLYCCDFLLRVTPDRLSLPKENMSRFL